MPLTARIPARPLAVYRVILGVVATLRCGEAAPDLWSLLEPATYRTPWVPWMPAPDRAAVVAILALWALAGVAFTVGLRTRLAGTVAGLAMAAVLLVDAQTYSNHLYLLSILVPLVAWAGGGRALGLDARRGHGSDTVAAWPALLVQTQLTAVYLFGALSKIVPDFVSGGMMVEMLPASLLAAVPPAVIPWLLVGCAVSVVVVELLVAVGLWLPRHRRDAMSAALLLHLGMITLIADGRPRIALFAAIMLGGFVLWLDARPGARTVVWDDSCSACARWVRLFRALDWLGALTFRGSGDAETLARLGITRAQADEALQFVGPRSRESGFRGVVAILEMLPATFLAAPFLRLPGVRHLGDASYRRYASRRRCQLPAARAATPAS